MRRVSGVALGLAVVLTIGACDAPSPDEQAAGDPTAWQDQPGEWARLPDAPLSPRHASVLFDLGDKLLVLGGDTHPGCHDTTGIEAPDDGESSASNPDSRAASGAALVLTSGAACTAPMHETRLSDGAVFDFRTGEWTRIADAPVPVSYSSGALLDDRLYLWVAGGFVRPGQVLLTYDPASDQWGEMEMPDELVDSYGVRLLAAGDRLLAYEPFADEHGTRDWLYDPDQDSWTTLPQDPLKPSHDRQLFWVDGRWFLLGPARADSTEDAPSFQRAAALVDGAAAWRRLDDSEIVATMGWSLVGEQIVSAQAGVTDGFGSYERSYAYGGILDTSSGHWSALPPVPAARPDDDCDTRGGEIAEVHQEAGPRAIVRAGWVLRVAEKRWESVPCNAERAEHFFSTEWVGDRLVTWGGYDTIAEPGRFPTAYEFRNDGWIWRPGS